MTTQQLIQTAPLLGISPEVMTSRAQVREVSDKRKMMIGLGKKNNIPFLQIAKALNRHHTTILELYQHHENYLITDSAYQEAFNEYSKAIHE